MSRTACPSFLLLLVREEKMLGTCAHLWDPTSPISIAGTTPGQLAIEEEGFWTEGFGKGCFVATWEGLSLISCPDTDFLDDLGLPGSFISTFMY